MSALVALLLPLAGGVACAFAFDLATRRRGFDPPGFADPLRRVLGLAPVALAAAACLAPLAVIGESPVVDFSNVAGWELFETQALFLFAAACWGLAGYAGLAREPGEGLARRIGRQLGIEPRGAAREAGIGLVAGFGAWIGVLSAVVALAFVLAALGAEDLLPKSPPAAIPFLAGQPVGLRLGLALAAGICEELVFRGLLQPRVGLLASTGLFALAHLSYDQPFLLVGVTLLSLLYGLLVRWRRSIVPAIVAHFLFDAVQLVVVIPALLDLVGAAPSAE